MKIYIDFDRTLFDCDRFIEDFDSLLLKYNILKDDFNKYQSQCKKFIRLSIILFPRLVIIFFLILYLF